MSTTYTPEPWQAEEMGSEGSMIFANRLDLPHLKIIARNVDPDHAARIVACVTACAGINPEAVPNAIKALRLACQYVARGVVEHAYDNCTVSGEHALERIETALAALEAKPLCVDPLTAAIATLEA